MAEQKATTSVLYEETRVFEPSKDLVEKSNVMEWMKKKGFKTEREMRAWTGQNYMQFWDEMAKTYADWFEPYGPGPRMEATLCQVVRGRQVQRGLQCSGQACQQALKRTR